MDLHGFLRTLAGALQPQERTFEIDAEPVIRELELKCEVEFAEMAGIMLESDLSLVHSFYAWEGEDEGHHQITLLPDTFDGGCSCTPNEHAIRGLVRAFQVERVGGWRKFKVALESGGDDFQFEEQQLVLAATLSEQFTDVVTKRGEADEAAAQE